MSVNRKDATTGTAHCVDNPHPTGPATALPGGSPQRLISGLVAQRLGLQCPPGAALLVLAIVGFSMADAFLTLKLLLAGAVELNPMMSRLLAHGVQVFVNWKLILTAGAALFLLTVFEVRVFRALTVRRILETLVVGYAVLVVYESALLIAAH